MSPSCSDEMANSNGKTTKLWRGNQKVHMSALREVRLVARRREGCGLIAHLSNQLGSAAGAAASAAATVLVTAAAVSGLSRIAASASKLLVPASKSMAERPVRPPATIAGLDEIVWNPIEYAAHATMNVMIAALASVSTSWRNLLVLGVWFRRAA